MSVAKCRTFAPDALSVRERVEVPGQRLVSVRCPRPHCGGNIYVQSDLAGHMVDLICLLCGRNAGEIPTQELMQRHGVPWRDIEKAAWHSVPFLWLRR